MPLTRYFVWVGSVLLTLLFIADAYLPKLPPAGAIDELPPAIRIHSDQKWPERVVYDTSVPMPKAALAANPETNSSPPSKLREALAELRTIDAKLPANPKTAGSETSGQAQPREETRAEACAVRGAALTIRLVRTNVLVKDNAGGRLNWRPLSFRDDPPSGRFSPHPLQTLSPCDVPPGHSNRGARRPRGPQCAASVLD